MAFVRVVSVPIENVYSKNTNDDGVCTIVWTQFHFSFPNFVSSDQMVKYDLLHIYHSVQWRFIFDAENRVEIYRFDLFDFYIDLEI